MGLAEENKVIAATEDYLSTGAEGFSGNPHAERIIERSSDALMAVYRVCKNMLVHDADNEAVQQTLELAHKILADFGRLFGCS